MTVGRRITKDFEIECVSPVHIGSGETLTAAEYIFDADNKKVYFINQTKWVQFLCKKGLIDEFFQYVGSQEVNGALDGKGMQFKGKPLWEWLKEESVTREEIKSFTARAGNFCGYKKVNLVARHIADGYGHIYIPGSSIKGALRTGILSYLIRKNKEECMSAWNSVKDSIFKAKLSEGRGSVQNGLKAIQDELEKALLGKLIIRDEGRERYQGITKDALRGLIISDAICVKPMHHTVITQKLDGSLEKKTDPNKIPLFRECIPAGTRLRFSVTADLDMLKVIGFGSIDDIFSATREYVVRNLKFQEQAFTRAFGRLFFATQAFNEAKQADLFLGGGTGFQYKTIIYDLAPDEEKGRAVITKYLDVVFPKHKHKIKDKDISPRTVKLTNQGQGHQLMGLCRLKEV